MAHVIFDVDNTLVQSHDFGDADWDIHKLRKHLTYSLFTKPIKVVKFTLLSSIKRHTMINLPN